MKIEIPEFIIDNVSKTPHKQLKIVLFVKEEDYNDKIENDLYLSSKKAGSWESFAWVFQAFKKVETKQENPLQTLNYYMEEYCKANNIDIQKEKNKIYNEYGVSSRRELSPKIIKELTSQYETFKFSQ